MRLKSSLLLLNLIKREHKKSLIPTQLRSLANLNKAISSLKTVTS